MKFNTEITVVQPATGEQTKWQGPQIEADTIQEAEKAAFASIMYVSGENVPREQLSVAMQPRRSFAFATKMNNDDEPEFELIDAFFQIFGNEKSTLFSISEEWIYGITDEMIEKIIFALGVQVFKPLDPETIRMKNEKLFHPDFISKLDEAESIGGVVISYLPEV
jgi:hypothetical protein